MATKRHSTRIEKSIEGSVRFELVIGTADVAINMRTLGELLSLLEEFVNRYELNMKGMHGPGDETLIGLYVESATTNSPLKFAGYCSSASLLLLSVAVSLAGGEAELGKGLFKVNSVTAAVGNLRAAFRDNQKDFSWKEYQDRTSPDDEFREVTRESAETGPEQLRISSGEHQSIPRRPRRALKSDSK